MQKMKNEIARWVSVLEITETIENNFGNKKRAKASKEAQKALKKYIELIGTEFGD